MSNKDIIKKQAKRSLNLGLGIAELVGEQVGSIVKNLEKEGYVNRSEGKKIARELLSEANSLQKKLSSRLDKKVNAVVKSSGASSSTRKPKARSKKRK